MPPPCALRAPRVRRGLALGLVVSAYAAGTAVLAPVAAALLVAVGHGPTFVLLAGVLGGVLAVAAVLVPGGSTAPHPARSGASSPDPAVAAAADLRPGQRTRPRRLRAGGGTGRYPERGGAGGAAAHFGILVGRLVAGPLSDRVGRSAALHGNSALLVLACLPLAAGSRGPVALLALLLLGAQYGALFALTPAATSDAVPSKRFGTIFGRVFTGWGLAGLLAPVAAAVLAAQVGYDGAYRFFLVIAVLAWVCVAAYTRLIGDHSDAAGRPQAGD